MNALAEFVDLDARTFAGLPMPLTLRLPVRLTDMELEAFSRRVQPYQVERNEDGELEIMTPVGFRGGQREILVGRQLFDWAERNGGFVVSASAGYTLPSTAVRSPDASWTSQDRIEGLTDAELTGFPPLCPDFLIEILSETDSRTKLEAKMEMWIANGAKLAWMIDPLVATVSIYQAGEATEVLERPEWVEAHAVVPGFRLEMSRLWAK